MREQLERFLSWLLEARWFPEVDLKEKARLRSTLKMLRWILARMRRFSKEIPDARLARGLAEWESYAASTSEIAKQHIRTAPHIHISRTNKGSFEIAERLMCGLLIIRRLHPRRSAYEEVQRLLADPAQLPYLITVSEADVRALRDGTIYRPVTASEGHYLREGRDIPLRRYPINVKAIQSSVARLEEQIATGKASTPLATLHSLYAEYLWSQKGQAGFSDAEDAMLRALIPTEADRKGRNPSGKPAHSSGS